MWAAKKENKNLLQFAHPEFSSVWSVCEYKDFSASSEISSTLVLPVRKKKIQFFLPVILVEI